MTEENQVLSGRLHRHHHFTKVSGITKLVLFLHNLNRKFSKDGPFLFQGTRKIIGF
jgi:hypothetical protein